MYATQVVEYCDRLDLDEIVPRVEAMRKLESQQNGHSFGHSADPEPDSSETASISKPLSQ